MSRVSPGELERCMQMSREERDRLVIELYERGVPVEEIARKACINKATIYIILRRHGLEPMRRRGRRRKRRTKLTSLEEEMILREYLNGTPVRELLEKYDISSSTLYRILKKHGVELRKKVRKRRRVTEEEVEEIRRLLEQGRSIYSIAKALKRPVSTVYAVIRRLRRSSAPSNSLSEPDHGERHGSDKSAEHRATAANNHENSEDGEEQG